MAALYPLIRMAVVWYKLWRR